MGATYRFIADPSKPSPVLEWFRGLASSPREMDTSRATVFHFESMGQLFTRADGAFDTKNSPLVNVFSPQIKRGALWTVGEVHFLPTPLRQNFPQLEATSRAFATWLKKQECVFSNKAGCENEFDYYLEGSVRNYDPPVYAFPAGLAALHQGRYFVGDDDGDSRLDKICSALRLRGVECSN
ncbi:MULTISPECIES: hypothetical protein [unclassified Variovorax]|uniref:hypothetical protein n=1 Tax=unclassified Variovorax TaxID=663243 RepID=UPI003F4875C6